MKRLDLGKWAHLAARGPFALPDVPSFAGISGGKTSGMMGALLPASTVRCFENVGMEHPKTYEFVERLSDAYEASGLSPITWLEWRPPARKGAPPRDFGFVVVTPRTAHRGIDLLMGILDALADYRATKGLPPIEPWARQRLCTAYGKHRVQAAFTRAHGLDSWDDFIGLRADEPQRVARLLDAETSERGKRTPLASAGITRCDVDEFWSAQSFTLEIEPYQGNCTGCFLKDESDLSRALGEPETDAAAWLAIQAKYPGFGGREKPTYKQLLAERPIRLDIERHIRSGTHAEYQDNPQGVDRRRFRLLVAQEKARAAGERKAFSCSCEASIALADLDDQLDLFGAA